MRANGGYFAWYILIARYIIPVVYDICALFTIYVSVCVCVVVSPEPGLPFFLRLQLSSCSSSSSSGSSSSSLFFIIFFLLYLTEPCRIHLAGSQSHNKHTQTHTGTHTFAENENRTHMHSTFEMPKRQQNFTLFIVGRWHGMRDKDKSWA